MATYTTNTDQHANSHADAETNADTMSHVDTIAHTDAWAHNDAVAQSLELVIVKPNFNSTDPYPGSANLATLRTIIELLERRVPGWSWGKL